MSNLSKSERQKMIEFLQKIREAHSDDESLIAINKIETALTEKKYGLVWEKHEERVDIEMLHNVPVFTELKEKEVENNSEKPFNFLLEGDNLHSLRLLTKTHKGMIDLIYIDPPYNTKEKDFMYDDVFIGEDDSFRHSKWLSFMNERLRIARELLSENGAIFIQISDIEVAQLKMLCDEIFGEDNFLNIISVNVKNIAGASGGGEDKKFKKNCEYILVYAKNYSMLPLFNGAYEYTRMSELVHQYKDEGVSWKYNSVLVDVGEKEYITSTVDGDGNEIRIYKRTGLVSQSIAQYAKAKGISEDDVFDYHFNRIYRTTMPQSSIRPRVMAKMQEIGRYEDVISIEYIPKTGRNKGVVYEQFYSGEKYNLFAWLSDVTDVRDGIGYKKDLQGTYWNFVAGTKNLSKEGNMEFKNGKKPLELIKRIVSLYPSNDITVCDFFAGSGTTGHAVVSLNEEDGGTRKFILCTNNENNICSDVTYPRLVNVINGYTIKRKETKGIPANLKYYKTDFVCKSSYEPDYSVNDELLHHIEEMVQLEYAVKLDDAKYVLLSSDEEADAFIADESKLKKCKAVYVSSDVLLTAEQDRKLFNNGINIYTIPDYYFESELLEVGER